MAKRVLFLCTGNSCRSQMAEGWLRYIAGNRVEVSSAGTKPAALNSMAVAVMREAGIDISHHHSKHIDEFAKQDFLFVITVCDSARETCPNFPGALYQLHWSFDDPAAATGSEEERLAVFRRVRDEIRNQVLKFAEHEFPGPGASGRTRSRSSKTSLAPSSPLEEWEGGDRLSESQLRDEDAE